MNDKELKVKQKQEVEHRGETTKPEKHFIPAVDIFENDEQVTVIAEMPGVPIEAIDVSLEEDLLTITGTKQPDELPHARILIHEYETGHYLRRFTLAETIDREKVKASLNEGMLTIVLPKTVPEQPKKIEIKVG